MDCKIFAWFSHVVLYFDVWSSGPNRARDGIAVGWFGSIPIVAETESSKGYKYFSLMDV